MRDNWAGYPEHRYGPRNSRTPRLPSISILKQPPQDNLIKGEKRTALVGRTADLMRDWKANRWEAEAATRAGLRISLIALEVSWERADAEAASIVKAAFNTLGRGLETRPTHEQGQRWSTYGPDHCLWCFGPLDDEDIAHNRRFCCPEHARAAIIYFDWETYSNASEIGNHAGYLIRLDKAETRVCEACQKEFKTINPNARFCSKKCHLDHNEQTLPVRLCRWCLKPFQPRHESQIFCCEAHNQLAKEQRKKHERHRRIEEQPEKECAHCRQPFRPKRLGRATDIYCSEKCQKAASHQREKVRAKARALT